MTLGLGPQQNSAALTIVADPVQLVAGGTASVPCPADATMLPWVIITNASPWTLTVRTGVTAGQVAAFTADAFRTGNGQPIELTAVAGSQQVAPGQDSTAYAAWSLEEPKGTYPAAVGAGAAGFVTNTFIAGTNVTAATPDGTLGPFDTAGYRGMRCMVNNLDSSPLLVDLQWSPAASVGSGILAHKYVLIPASGMFSLAWPHLGDQLTLSFTTIGGTLGAVVYAAHHDSDAKAWAAGPAGLGVLHQYAELVLNWNGQSIAAGAVGTLNALAVYAGPATFVIDPEVSTNWSARLEAQGLDGTWRALVHRDQTFGAYVQNVQLDVPARPLRISYRNNDAGARSPNMLLVPRDWS